MSNGERNAYEGAGSMTTTSDLRCFVDCCDGAVVLTRSWLGGPTLHACKDHVLLIPHKRATDVVSAEQARLL